jgi:hypothetical protein
VSTKAVLLLLLLPQLLLLLWCTSKPAAVVDRFDFGRLNKLVLLLVLLLPVRLLSVWTGMAAPVLGTLPAKEPAGL